MSRSCGCMQALVQETIVCSLRLFFFQCLGTAALLFALPAMGQTPGDDVNVVSGTKWPGGDPFLQRQNEPSLAVSTRNPRHILAGANDYRTVDIPLDADMSGPPVAAAPNTAYKYQVKDAAGTIVD